MKRILLFAIFVATIVGLPVVAVSQQLDPGCDQGVMKLLTNQANAIRARDRAYEREIINRVPSTLYLTCFDQAMALSAKLGYIFSDNVPMNPPPPPANTKAFTNPLLYPHWGTRNSLVVDLDNVMSQEVDNELLGNGPPPVPALVQNNFLPPWQTPNQLTVLANTVRAIINNIAAYESANDDPLTGVNPPPPPGSYMDLVNQIDALVQSFPTLDWTTLPPALTQYDTLMTQLAAVLTAIKAERNNIAAMLDQIKTDVMNNNMTCANMDDLWDSGGAFNTPSNNDFNPAADYYSPEGNYYALTPYYTIEELFNYGNGGALTSALAVPPSPPSTKDFTNELQLGNDSALLQGALNDLVGQLAQPGLSPIWPAPPTFAPNAVAIDVIQQM